MERKRVRLRSPGYPLIDLKEAVHKANVLWEKDKSNPIPKEVACEHLGYKTKEGYAGRIIAALKHFNLLLDKHGDIILTQSAVDLSIHEPTDSNYIETLKILALKPAIYKKIFEEYNGELPSDSTLKVKLIKDYNFNPDKIANFINTFRSTVAFAGLDKTVESNEKPITEEKAQEKDVFMQPTTKSGQEVGNVMPKGIETFPIPLSKGRKAAIVFEGLPVDSKDIEAIKKWLEFFSDNLTET